LTLDDSDLMLVAALAGEGLAFLSDIAAAKSIEAGLLLPVLEDWSPEFPGLCLYYPSRRNIPDCARSSI
jgi:DNA-binding transcriptional LysR family regulator